MDEDQIVHGMRETAFAPNLDEIWTASVVATRREVLLEE
jgi:hypothetical protein